MLRITENKDEIIVREFPVAQWIGSAAIIIVLSLTVYFTQFLFKEKGFHEWHWTIGGIINILAFVFFLVTNPATSIKIDKKNRIISVSKQSLVKYGFKTYLFNEIADLIYVDERKGSREILYQLALPLKSGQRIELSTSIARKEGEFFKAADLMNEYIFDSPSQIPFKLTVFHDN